MQRDDLKDHQPVEAVRDTFLSDLEPVPAHEAQGPASISSEDVIHKILEGLDESSSIGPDVLPARILKRCAKRLARPLRKLLTRTIATGQWPEGWVHQLDRASA